MNLIEKDICSGCAACMNICPHGCINMLEDEDGFLYPNIDHKLCINCGLCKNICPIGKSERHLPIATYGVKNKIKSERLDSTSGGMFSVLAKYVLEKSGVVFGCKFNSNLEAVHDYIEKFEDIDEFRGAKYVQSRINYSYKNVKSFLDAERYVLFSGTPCQVAGLDAYLGKDYNKLIKCDLACHSVPSPKALKSYIEELQDKNKKSIEKIWFRRKDIIGWDKANLKVLFSDGTFYQEILANTPFMKGFIKGLFNRTSCASCSYKNFKGKSDITIADYWGIKSLFPDFFDNSGVSLVFVNTEKGKILFDKISCETDYIETKIEDATKNNPLILAPIMHHRNRRDFFERIDKEIFSDVVDELV